MERITKLANFDFKSRWLSTNLDKGISKPSLPARFIYRAFEKIGLSHKYSLQKIDTNLKGFITRATPQTAEDYQTITNLVTKLETFQTGHATKYRSVFSSSIAELKKIQPQTRIDKTNSKPSQPSKSETQQTKKTKPKTRHSKRKKSSKRSSPNKRKSRKAPVKKKALLTQHLKKAKVALAYSLDIQDRRELDFAVRKYKELHLSTWNTRASASPAEFNKYYASLESNLRRMEWSSDNTKFRVYRANQSSHTKVKEMKGVCFGNSMGMHAWRHRHPEANNKQRRVAQLKRGDNSQTDPLGKFVSKTDIAHQKIYLASKDYRNVPQEILDHYHLQQVSWETATLSSTNPFTFMEKKLNRKISTLLACADNGDSAHAVEIDRGTGRYNIWDPNEGLYSYKDEKQFVRSIHSLLRLYGNRLDFLYCEPTDLRKKVSKVSVRAL